MVVTRRALDRTPGKYVRPMTAIKDAAWSGSLPRCEDDYAPGYSSTTLVVIRSFITLPLMEVYGRLRDANKRRPADSRVHEHYPYLRLAEGCRGRLKNMRIFPRLARSLQITAAAPTSSAH